MALEKWKFDTVHSTVGFSVRHLMISRVHGVFKSWTGSMETDETHPENSKVHVTIDAASIDTKDRYLTLTFTAVPCARTGCCLLFIAAGRVISTLASPAALASKLRTHTTPAPFIPGAPGGREALIVIFPGPSSRCTSATAW